MMYMCVARSVRGHRPGCILFRQLEELRLWPGQSLLRWNQPRSGQDKRGVIFAARFFFRVTRGSPTVIVFWYHCGDITSISMEYCCRNWILAMTCCLHMFVNWKVTPKSWDLAFESSSMLLRGKIKISLVLCCRKVGKLLKGDLPTQRTRNIRSRRWMPSNYWRSWSNFCAFGNVIG